MKYKQGDFFTNFGKTYLIVKEHSPGMCDLRLYVPNYGFFDYYNVWLGDKDLQPASDIDVAKFIAGMMLKND